MYFTTRCQAAIISPSRGESKPLIRKEVLMMKAMFDKMEKFFEEYDYTFHTDRFE